MPLVNIHDFMHEIFLTYCIIASDAKYGAKGNNIVEDWRVEEK